MLLKMQFIPLTIVRFYTRFLIYKKDDGSTDGNDVMRVNHTCNSTQPVQTLEFSNIAQT